VKTHESSVAREIRIRVSSTIAADYERRGVASKFLPDTPAAEEKSTGAKNYLVSATSAVAIHDDALEQIALNKGRKPAGLNQAYASLWRQIAHSFGRPNPFLTPGYRPDSADSPGPMDRSGIQVGLLFLRLSIPAAKPERP
jgi:hypothetical protein